MFTLDDFDFELPEELIAQHPAATRTSSKLLHVEGEQLTDKIFSDILTLIEPVDLLVFNDTKVIKARLFGRKESGGKIEVMIERIVDAQHAIAQIRASKSPKAGSLIVLEEAFSLRVTGRTGADGEFFALELAEAGDLYQLIDQFGHLPLPPYITHNAEQEDESRYQTVFARHIGAVAAPTAGLHFDEALLDALKAQGTQLAWLTLHVGAGTFQPVRNQDLTQHKMHTETFHIPEETVKLVEATKKRGGRVISVGTTSLRALESGARSGTLSAGAAETDIFITPGYQFRVVDRLITNFHLPKSTLLMLVSAFAGYGTIRAAYRHAIANRYRFFSYGDAMLLEKQTESTLNGV